MANVTYLREGRFCLDDLSKMGVADTDLKKIESALKLPTDSRTTNFDYVGVIEVGAFLLISLPKSIKNNETQEKDARLLVKLLSSVARNKNVTKRLPDSAFLSFNQNDNQLSRLSIAWFLLEDFSKNGQISFKNERHVANDIRNPDWIRTINKVLPIESWGGPVYDRWISKKKDIYSDSLIQQIHETVINECLDFYGEILSFNKRDMALSANQPSIPKHAANVISAKLRSVFVQRNVQVLKALKRWIQAGDNSSNLSFYGTRHFHVVWEEVCSLLMSNIKTQSIWQDAFVRPRWTNLHTRKVAESETFEIDILTQTPENLILADAKYYNTDVDCVLGVGDVSKQIQYEKLILASAAFQRIFEGDKRRLRNIFIFPGQHDEHIKSLCKIEFPILHDGAMYGVTFDTAQSFERYIARNSLSSAEIARITSGLS